MHTEQRYPHWLTGLLYKGQLEIEGMGKEAASMGQYPASQIPSEVPALVILWRIVSRAVGGADLGRPPKLLINKGLPQCLLAYDSLG